MRRDFRKPVGDRLVRLIETDEPGVLDRAVTMHNSWWSNGLQLNAHALTVQIQNGGIMLGIFSKADMKLLGFIQGFRIPFSALQRKLPWTQSWDGITAQGSFVMDDPDADCLVCVNIVREKTARDNGNHAGQEKLLLTPEAFQNYLRSDKDPSIRFHLKAKGGYKDQPTIMQVLPQGRPKDEDALGYNVLFLYPKIDKEPVLTQEASPTIQLVEAAMLYCHARNIPHLVAYSRPLFLSRYFRLV